MINPAALPSATAQSEGVYAGKTLNVVVGVQVGGTADTIARRFMDAARKHIPGAPTIVVQNMTGAGSNIVFNYFAERGQPDGQTIVFSSYQALAQALGDPSLRARFGDFEYIGGVSDARVSYMRTDAVPGGLKTPADIMKASDLMVGTYSTTDFEGTLSHMSLDVLGVKHRRIVGYRGGSDIFLAMQRGEVQFHNTSVGTYRTRSAAFVKSGEGKGVYYLATVDPSGAAQTNPYIDDMPAFPDLFREIYGHAPSGPTWEALNWLTRQTSELAYVAFALKKTPPEALAALRAAFEATAADPEFIAQSVAINGLPYSFVNVDKGRAIIRSLDEVSPQIIGELKASMESKN